MSSSPNFAARAVLPAFKENGQDVWEKDFRVPKLFDYYNKYMGEVDRFNALVAVYTSQRACNRKPHPSNCAPIPQAKGMHRPAIAQLVSHAITEDQQAHVRRFAKDS